MNLSSFTLKALTAAVILASTTSVALAKGYKGEANYKGEVAPCPPPVMLKDGFYLGGQVGYDSYRVRESSTLTGGGTTFSANPSVAATGWVGGLFLGYGQYLTDLFYLGAEINGNYSGAEENHTVGTPATFYNSKVEVRGSGAISLLPGIKLNDTSLGYVRLGWNWVSLKANQSFTTTAAPATSYSGSKTNTSNGFGFGVGIETLVWDNWSVRTEYDHTYLNSFNVNATGAAGGSGSTSYNPSDNQFTVGVLYHFA